MLLCRHTRFPPTHRSSLYRSSLVGTVICARQLFGDNTVLPHYESHTVNLTARVGIPAALCCVGRGDKSLRTLLLTLTVSQSSECVRVHIQPYTAVPTNPKSRRKAKTRKTAQRCHIRGREKILDDGCIQRTIPTTRRKSRRASNWRGRVDERVSQSRRRRQVSCRGAKHPEPRELPATYARGDSDSQFAGVVR